MAEGSPWLAFLIGDAISCFSSFILVYKGFFKSWDLRVFVCLRDYLPFCSYHDEPSKGSTFKQHVFWFKRPLDMDGLCFCKLGYVIVRQSVMYT